jgi:hypothetical protein
VTDLSPEALAVICAAQAANQDDISSIAAAALRAAARQTIPETPRPNSGNAMIDAFACEAWHARNFARLKLLDIADELEECEP